MPTEETAQIIVSDRVEIRFDRACPVRGTVVALRPNEIKVQHVGNRLGEWFADSKAVLIERPEIPERLDAYGNALSYAHEGRS
jgi:hypothetical protein